MASTLPVLKGLLGVLQCKAAAIWLQAIFSLFILCWCIMCSSVETWSLQQRDLNRSQGRENTICLENVFLK